jgi:hypothetical protein
MSNGVRVLCPDCGDLVSHQCHNDIRQAVIDLMSWVPDSQGFASQRLNKAFEAAGREAGWIAEDETLEHIFDQPFFGSQSWVYPLFGSKDTARSFFAYLHNLIRALNIDPDEIREQIYAAREAREAAENERKARVQQRQDERAAEIAFLKGNAPLEERIAKLDAILIDRAKSLNPLSDKDDGYNHLYKYLDGYYGGGISRRVNRARIERLRMAVVDARKSV